MIYIIITASIINKEGVVHDEHRKNRYMTSIQSLLKLVENDDTVKVIVVENNGSRQTYLDELQCDVIYTNNNSISCTHKGVKELMDIQYVIKHYNIQDDDIVIKLTGRYKILDLSFLNTVKNNIEKYDAYVKFFNVCTLRYGFNDSVLGLIAIRCKYIKDFEYSHNYAKSPETEFAEHVRRTIDKDRIMEITKLGLECCFADNLRLLYV